MAARQRGPHWSDLFPYDEPYADQRDAIEKVRETVRDSGFAALEAACGTGKTLISLNVAGEAIRDPSTKYKRAIVLTSVRQQLRAFEDDLELLNQELSEEIDPFDALTLVGKKHLCAYAQADTPQLGDESFYSDCDDLRKPVRDVISNAGGPNSASSQLQTMINAAGASGSELEGDNWLAPYQEEIPDDEGGFCPFYANYRKEFAGEDGYNVSGVMRPWDTLREGAETGVCPHAMAMSGMENAEFLICNYKHLFDPLTVQTMTAPLIDDETIVIIDEAHGLVENVRKELSDELALQTVAGAVEELKDLKQSDSNVKSQIWNEMQQLVGDADTVENVLEFLVALQERLETFVVDMLDDEDTDWHTRDHGDLPDEVRKNLCEPKTPAEDDISTWIELAGYTGAFNAVDDVAEALDTAYDSAEEEHHYTIDDSRMVAVGHRLARWRDCDHETYFRQFYLDKREIEFSSRSGYEQHYTAKLTLRNCIPRDEIADRLDEFGAGMLMSATLSPLDVYLKTSGLDVLAEQGRRVDTMTYGLRYPEVNRESVAVDVPKFTRSNRGGDPWQARGEQRKVRDQYYEIVQTTVQETDGNVLVALPNYEEARWVADELSKDRTVQKPVEADGSDVESEALRRWFVNGEAKVLTTGLRGTLTEGVDYDGDKLKACVVIGLPIRSLAGDYPDAIRAAYETEFGSNQSFEYAFTMPALHKSRQALGRVIRGEDEVGVRVLADRRYANNSSFDDVRSLLPAYEQADYDAVNLCELESRLRSFWKRH